MSSIQVRKETSCLIIDFYYNGIRCREQTALKDTTGNRKKIQQLLTRMDAEILAGTFEYQRYFPKSKLLTRLNPLPGSTLANTTKREEDKNTHPTPLLRDFVETWFSEKEVEWRNSHRKVIRYDLTNRIIPAFGDKEVGKISKADILSYRAELAKVNAQGKETKMSNRRINRLVNLLRQIVNEAADRFDFRTPFQNIKQLKVKRSDVHPFTLDEVKLILEKVRPDYRNYFTVRFFTGLRSGEIHGLKWKYVDFEKRLIMVRETVVDGEEEYTKNDSSQRDIRMSQVVFDALKAQDQATRALSAYVFCNVEGNPLNNTNVANRVWNPLLRYLGLEHRRPYQCRHTAATLWLAAGESPEWIARQMGHTTTEMLFRVYSRYVPNLTRQDGSAFERLLLQNLPRAITSPTHTDQAQSTPEVCHE
ncbi:MAG: DUF3596 domain-containing protein [Betaproteobacteria bacterium]|nr:DUF3596 domain-containing protein [Betaproteobacteria bacterium]